MSWTDTTREHYKRELSRYPSDLRDAEYAGLEEILPGEKHLGRRRKTPLREVLNAVFYCLRSGCQWRMLPKDFPPWKTVYGYYRCWVRDGTWQRMHDHLYSRMRLAEGRKPSPTGSIIDSQTVKTTEAGGERGYDGAKKIKGRKRHIAVDTIGLLIACVVHSADGQDRDTGPAVMKEAKAKFKTLAKLWADGGYRGERFFNAFQAIGKWSLEIVKPSDLSTFVVLPRRWVVERTFAWINRNRRLAKDFEKNTCHSKAYCFIAMTALMIRRLHRI